MKKVAISLLISSVAVMAVSKEQNEFIKQQQQFQQFQRNEQQRWLNERQYQNTEKLAEITDLSTQCLPFRELKIVGASLVDLTAVMPKKGECLNEIRLNQLSRDVTQAYLSNGYVHNPFSFESDGSDVLRLSVTEGKVRKLTTESHRLNLAMLFPNLVDQPLNIKTLDQGLDQANRMAKVDASVDVLPSADGNIDLVFTNEDKSAFSGSIGLDNSSSKRYGDWQTKIGVGVDNLLQLSDSFYLSASSTLKDRHKNYSRYVSFFHRIPYGNWTFNSYGLFSRSHLELSLPHSLATQQNKNWQLGGKVDYMFHRGSNHISTFSTQLEKIKNRSEFNGSELELQSPQLTTLQFQLNHLQLFQNGSAMVNFSYERGLTWWNALNNQESDQPEGQFNKWNLSLYLQHFYKWREQLFVFNHQLDGQYSQNYLPSIKQAELLGEYAVRGFKMLSQSAEKQLVLKNKISWLYRKATWNVEPYIAFDIGGQKASTQSQGTTKAWGYGAGVKIQSLLGNMELSWSKGQVNAPSQNFKQKEQMWLLSWFVHF